mgnify:CR=1 FL=1
MIEAAVQWWTGAVRPAERGSGYPALLRAPKEEAVDRCVTVTGVVGAAAAASGPC